MRLTQLQRPVQAAAVHGGYRPVLTAFSLPIRPAVAPSILSATPAPADAIRKVEGRRYASVKSQGAYRIPNKKTIAKKMGAKKSGDQYVIPGNIIYKQRGTLWHPGQNALKGRDHTIHAAIAGYVKYYRDPSVHPTRGFIGVAFNKEDTLPYPKDEPRRRKLGMVPVVRKEKAPREPGVRYGPSGLPLTVVRPGGLFDIEELRKRLWSRERMREMKAARKAAGMVRKKERGEAKNTSTAAPSNKSADAAAPKAENSTTTALAVAVATEPQQPQQQQQQEPEEKKKKKGSGRMVMPQEFLQKRWLERRRTRVLHLNPRNYSYSESNAAIGRLASRTMYTPKEKLGGRKSRFRSSRKRRELILRGVAERKAVSRVEKKERRAAEEEKKQKQLEKQREQAAKRAAKALADAKAKAAADQAAADANKAAAGEPKPTES